RRSSDLADVFYMLRMSLKNQEYAKLALPYLLRATELHPADVEYVVQYGLSLAQSNYIDEPKQIFEKVLSLHAEHSDAHYNRGVLELYHDRPEKARQHFDMALTYQKDHLLAMHGKKKVEELLDQTSNCEGLT